MCAGLCFVAVTGASFVVFNGALKASSGFIAKSSIVEGNVTDWLSLTSSYRSSELSWSIVTCLMDVVHVFGPE